MFVEPQLSPSPEVHASARRAPAPPPALRVGMIGTGTVGSGVWRVLRRNRDLINARAGRAIEIVAVAARNTARAAAALDGWASDVLAMHPLRVSLVRVMDDPTPGVVHGVIQIECAVEG